MMGPSLREVLERLIPEESGRILGRPPADDSSPWFVRALLGFGAWNAAILLLIFCGLMDLFDSEAGMIFVGVLAWTITTFARRSSRSEFGVQLRMACNIAGQVLIAAGVGEATNELEPACLVAMAVGTATVIFYRDTTMRFLSTLAVLAAAGLLAGQSDSGLGFQLLVLVTAVAAGAVWLAPPRWDLGLFGDLREPVGFGLAAGLYGLLVIGCTGELRYDDTDWLATLGLAVAMMALGLGQRNATGVAMAAAIALLGVITLGSPGVLAALGGIVIAYHRRSIILLGLSIVFLVVFIWFYYYDLHISLLAKSGVLFLSGCVLLALRFLVARKAAA